MQQKQNRKRIAITVALVACLASVAGLGTLAWLTAQDDVSNVFTIGNFTDPDNKPKPDEGGDQDEDEDESKPNDTNGYLFETNWNEDDNKLMAGVPVAKNPNVGIGAGGDDAFVFIYVQNKALKNATENAASAPYFTIENQWAAVSGEVTPSTAKNDTGTEVTNAYTDGLFMYVQDRSGGNMDPVALTSSDTPDTDTYTGELFENVTMPLEADFHDYADDPTINVFAFIYGYDADADPNADGSAEAALAAAKEWAGKIKGGSITVSPSA